MEANLWKALHDPATLSELAILALYGEAVSYPYMKAICSTSDSGEKQNMLNLGPLHKKVVVIITPWTMFTQYQKSPPSNSVYISTFHCHIHSQ